MWDDYIVRERATSFEGITLEDETYFTANGSLGKVDRGLRLCGGDEGEYATKTKATTCGTSSGLIEGYMFNIVIEYGKGAIAYYYKKSTEDRWNNDPDSRYQVRKEFDGVYSISVPHHGRISQYTHLYITRAIHPRRETKAAHGYDGAGPHGEHIDVACTRSSTTSHLLGATCNLLIHTYSYIGGRLIYLALKAANREPLCPPKGGHSSVCQLNDDRQVHGGLKQYVRRQARRYYVLRARVYTYMCIRLHTHTHTNITMVHIVVCH